MTKTIDVPIQAAIADGLWFDAAEELTAHDDGSFSFKEGVVTTYIPYGEIDVRTVTGQVSTRRIFKIVEVLDSAENGCNHCIAEREGFCFPNFFCSDCYAVVEVEK